MVVAQVLLKGYTQRRWRFHCWRFHAPIAYWCGVVLAHSMGYDRALTVQRRGTNTTTTGTMCAIEAASYTANAHKQRTQPSTMKHHKHLRSKRNKQPPIYTKIIVLDEEKFYICSRKNAIFLACFF